MPDNETDAAERVRAAMAEALAHSGSVRTFAMRSRLSEPTIRKIAETGVVSTMATAAKLELATDGAIAISDALRGDARGDIYATDPGLAILNMALRQGVEVSEALKRLGLTHSDLWAYVNHGGGEAGTLRRRVRAALELAGLPTGPEAAL
jgi:hypothetical protein